MREDLDRDSPAVAGAFLARFLDDREAGRPRPLAEYQSLFPGYEGLIAQEYEKLSQDGADPWSRLVAGSTPRLAESLPSGDQAAIGPYRTLEVIGRGGMGVVYLAESGPPVRRRVALKLIKLGLDTREVLARFASERQALALMNHPHIARVYDAGSTESGRPYFVMEHVPGIPITQFCDQHQLGTRERLEIHLQVCDAVQHAHQKGVIHRDLKPANVLVAYEDGKAVAKIIDFGVAKSIHGPLTDQTLYTELGQLIGTPEYMSPEQAEKSPLDIDTRSDIYSLGVLLYELLVGKLPFEVEAFRAGGPAEIQRRIREGESPPPSTRLSRLGPASAGLARNRRSDVKRLLRELRGDLDWITMKAMEKDRSRRYASASEMAADIRRHLRDEPVLAGPPGVGYRLRKLARKHRTVLVAAGITALLLAATAAVSLRVAGVRHEEAKVARSRDLYREGLERWRRHVELKDALAARELEWRRKKERHKSWEPVWERADELEAWRRLGEARQVMGLESLTEYNRTVLSFQKAMDELSPGSPARVEIERNLETLYYQSYRESLDHGDLTLGPEFFRAMVGSLGVGTYEKAFEEGSVALASDPPGATVYCFRYENHEERLLPLPFDPRAGRSDPAKGLAAGPYLEVERVWEPGLSPFAAGDRLLAVRGAPVSSRSDLAEALSKVGEGEPVETRLLRGGEERSVSWMPFPPSSGKRDRDGALEAEIRPGRVLAILEQFGITFAGYPLAFPESCAVGVTAAGEPLRVELPRGSYLFVFRSPGRAPARFPVAIPRDAATAEGPEVVKLLPEEALPSGFLYVPEGPVALGGDAEVDQALGRATPRIGGFLIARLEVTVAEYLEFVNDPEVAPTIDTAIGFSRAPGLPGDGAARLPLIPREPGGLLFHFDEGPRAWRPAGGIKDDWPVLGLFESAGKEYAAWRTRRAGGRWRFRLPTDLEWERAARGVDRRFYVWGNYPVWSFCRSLPGGLRRSAGPVGAFPADESIFGVRDLAGSALEPTSGETAPGFVSLRGGSWREGTEYYYRIANRLGRWRGRQDPGVDLGLRLAADLPR